MPVFRRRHDAGDRMPYELSEAGFDVDAWSSWPEDGDGYGYGVMRERSARAAQAAARGAWMRERGLFPNGRPVGARLRDLDAEGRPCRLTAGGPVYE